MAENGPAGNYIRLLESSDLLRHTVVKDAVSSLRLPAGSSGLDAACGIGSNTLVLAEAVGPSGHVTGIDISASFLDKARRRAAGAGLADRVSFETGDLLALPFEDDTFDWLWCMDCTTPLAENPSRSIRELARVVRPHGSVSILMWSSQQLLPGYPGLEARLNATSKGIAPFRNQMAPDQHHFRALGWLRRGGLLNCRAETFVGTITGPLDEGQRDSIAFLLDMRWGGVAGEVSDEDRAEFDRLCQRESPHFIANDPDYYAFFTYSLFSGVVG